MIINRLKLNRFKLLSFSLSSSKFSTNNIKKSRFWSQIIPIKLPINVQHQNIPPLIINDSFIDILKQNLIEYDIDITKIDMGIATIDDKLLIPIQDGKIQTQHVTNIQNNSKSSQHNAIICGFNTRASVYQSQVNTRVIDINRSNALDIALFKYSTTNKEGNIILMKFD
jgi:hypothetical protein